MTDLKIIRKFGGKRFYLFNIIYFKKDKAKKKAEEFRKIGFNVRIFQRIFKGKKCYRLYISEKPK